MMEETTTVTPDPQRLQALERANEVRLARAALKRRIALGELTAAEIIRKCPWEAKRWSIGELLMSQRRWGSTRCLKFLRHHQISELKPVGSLTERQRGMLAAALESCTRFEARSAGRARSELVRGELTRREPVRRESVRREPAPAEDLILRGALVAV